MKKIVLSFKNKSLNKSKPSVVTIILFILLVVYTIGLFVPIIWAIVASFMNKDDFVFYFGSMHAFKNGVKYTFDNYVFAWNNLNVLAVSSNIRYYIPDLLGHSVLYALECALAFTICPVIMAYATARFKFAFSKIIYAFVIFTMALPIVGSMASEIRMLHNLGIFDTFPSMIILRFNFLSIYFLILHAQFSSIPYEYSEAAKVDGASNFRVMWQIIIPQSLNTIVTVFVLSFISYWNDYQIPLLYLPSYPTAAFGIYDFVHNASPEGAFVPVQLAGTLIMVIPIVIVFIIFNKRIRVSVSMGGIKG